MNHRALSGGRLTGGPLVFSVLVFAAACGGRSGPGRPGPEAAGAIGRPLETYQQIGLLAGPGHFPAVAAFSNVAGPADSTYVLMGMSLPNSALRFQRDGSGFMAEYRVSVSFLQDTVVMRRFERQETVRVTTFAESTRTDESIVFQHAIAVLPGTYDVHVVASDANSSRGFRARDTLTVPAYGAEGEQLAAPVVVYEGRGRRGRAQPPELILNPRHTVAFGGDEPRIYLEAYGAGEPLQVRVAVVDETGTAVWDTRASIAEGDEVVRHTLIELPGGTLPLGKLWVQAIPERVATTTITRAPLVISISDQWMVANFDEVLQFLRYISTSQEMDSLSAGTPAERRERWERFWARRDPLPATPVNEFRDEFFQRVRFASEQFSEPGGLAGWKTDRGEVFIVLGPPQYTQDRFIGGRADVSGRPNAVEWVYDNLPGGRLNLLFVDRTGFGRYELSPASEAAFRSAAERLKPR